VSQKKRWPTGIRPVGKGLQIRVWKNGRLAHQETIECDPFKPADVAATVKRREWLKARLLTGLSISGEESKISLLGEVAQEYLETLEARDTTIIEYHRILNRWWMPELGTTPIQEVNGAQIKRVLSKMGVSTKTKRNRLIPLFGVFNHAEIRPPKIKLKREAAHTVVRYTPREREKVLKKLEGQAEVYFSVLFGCGLRPGEALALEWSDYDGEYLNVTKSISKRRMGPTKTGVSRRVYIPAEVRPLLHNHRTRFAGGYIFLNSHRGPCLDSDNFNGEWRQAHLRARIPYRIPYACRHTRAAELLSRGVAPARAAKELGHSVEMFLRIYSEFIEEYADTDMELFESVTAKKLARKEKK
jgi:integrase